jgi:hypothetical protein
MVWNEAVKDNPTNVVYVTGGTRLAFRVGFVFLSSTVLEYNSEPPDWACTDVRCLLSYDLTYWVRH